MVISFMFMSSTTRRMSGSGHTEPAMMPVRMFERSKRLNMGCSSSAKNMVGTPYTAVQRSLSSAASTLRGLNDSRITMVAPWFTAAETPSTQPKQWNSGTGRHTRSLVLKFWWRPIQ